MQTFLPYQDFAQSAACLDRLRLGKQRVETLQILQTLNGDSHGWRNHPVVKMWNDYTEALIEYGCAICDEWLQRGYRDTCRGKIVAYSWGGEAVKPPWLTEEFCLSHRQRLLSKDPIYYSQFNWT